MPIQSANGVFLSYRRETGSIGTLATNDATARTVPFVSHGLALAKTAIQSDEIRPDFQRATMRHGNRALAGDLTLQLQTGTYSPLMESAVRRDFTAVTAIAGLTVTSSATAPHFTRTAGSWITDGLTVGMCVRFSGFTSTGVPNNARNYTITALTATQMTVAEAVVARTGDTAVGVTVPGRVTFVPLTGHTQTSYSIEEWNPDVPRSNRYLGLRVNTMDIEAPPNAKAMLNFGLLGRDRATNASRYFTSASTPASSVMQVGHLGALVVNGVSGAVVTALKISLTNNMEVGAVVGSALTPDVFHGRMEVSGSVTVYFDSGTLDDVFDLETEIALALRVADDTTTNSNFFQLYLPRIKLAGGSFSTANQSRLQSFDFTALLHPGTSGNQSTTLLLQDGSLA
jgi:hypothetical protein